MHSCFVSKDLALEEESWQEVPPGVNVPVEWSSAQRDDLGCFDPKRPTRLTVPPGVTAIRLITSVAVKFQGEPPFLQIWSRLNGNAPEAGRLHAHLGYLSTTLPAGDYFGSSPALNASGPVLQVRPGDYFEIMVYQQGNNGIVRVKSRNSTFFSMEIIEYQRSALLAGAWNWCRQRVARRRA